MFTVKELQDFEQEIANLYKQGKIKAPIHLAGSTDGTQEKILIELFQNYYKKDDWIFSTHRSHFHWLLSGRSPEEAKKQILEGHSMQLCDDKFFTSSIVGGNAPIAVGTAWALKLKCSPSKVWCFVGDAAYECGIVQESIKYASRHDLPITFIIENNEYCVRARTQDVWGDKKTKKVIKYKFCREWPHAGNGEYVMF